ncbi:serine hydrolase domain-containing protein [Alteromonas halophila]|uniref:Beta-lactamase-related domain-containing protein n=1 Tax=Alteromonas halophila TaxID=516698 RepID=A0A918MZT8_9ALTE|nr:serine hydrolase domain-containing protein [Alteromonas halophila]GGW90421.1 hypothetical protein GCM10007391_25790 [Alteromonas halophila]
MQTFFSTLLIAALLLTGVVPGYAHAETSAEPGNSTVVTASYAEPEKWKKYTKGGVIRFEADEQDTYIAVVHITGAGSSEEAAGKAWRMVDEDFNREVRVNTPRNTDGGWNEKRRIEYVTTAAENKGVYAYTHRLDEQWYVVLLNGSNGTINKRSAAIIELRDSFRVKGYKPEDLSGQTAKKLTDKDIEQLLAFVESAAEALNVPGVGIAVSQKDQVLYQGGVGFANKETRQPVTADTLFMVASNTKGMATLLLAKLVELGKLDWKDKVVEHYPEFKLGDEQTTQSVRIEHLVCACTGLPRRDLGWIFNNDSTTSAKILFKDLATTQPTSEFGELYQYSNELAAAAGYIAGHVLYPDMELGAAFDKAMQQYIFDPLNMDSTVFSIEAALRQTHAVPYADDHNGNISAIEQSPERGFNHTVYPYRPAGAAWSSPADMINYVQNEITAGVGPDGKQRFAREPLLARRTPYVKTGEGEAYGMGLQMGKIAGIETLSHGGSMAGYMSNWYAFTDASVGLVVLTNSDEGWALLDPTARKLVELMYDAKPLAAAQIEVTAERKRISQQTQQQEFAYPGDADILRNLASRYSNDVLGELRVYEEDGDIFLDPGVWRTQLGTKENKDGTQSVVAVAPFLLGVEFLVEEVDGKKALTISYAQDSYTFTEQAGE